MPVLNVGILYALRVSLQEELCACLSCRLAFLPFPSSFRKTYFHTVFSSFFHLRIFFPCVFVACLPFLGAFAKVRNATISFIMSVSVRPSARPL